MEQLRGGDHSGPGEDGRNIQHELLRLQAALDRLVGLASGVIGQLEPGKRGQAAGSPALAPQLTPQLVGRIIKLRQARARFLGANLFADPAWDILLEAYRAELTQTKVSLTEMCRASGVPATTALRWIAQLEKERWLQRSGDSLDAGHVWLELTPHGSAALTRYFSAVSLDVLPI